MKALIKVGYSCNEHCSFCHTQDLRHIDGTAQEVEAKIRRAAQLGHSMVVLSGGEATIRPELMRWAALVAELGLDFGLVTNGLMLAYPDVVERLLGHRLRYVYMSLHGDAKIHNSLVRRPSYEAAYKALENLTGRGLDLTINCVVTKKNVGHLPPLVDSVLPFTDATLKFSLVEPKGGASHEFARLVPPVAEAAEAVADAIEYGRSKSTGLRFSHGGFPLCLLPGLEGDYDDLKTHRFWTMVEVGEPDFFPVDDANKVAPEPVCGDCSLRGACPGLYKAYLDRFGADELRPVRGTPISNSFDYVFEEVVDGDGESCPLLAEGVTPWDRARHLFVRHNGKIGRFRAASRDFSDADIDATKHTAGQIYVDASRKSAPDDFASDLVKLDRSPICTPCPERERCTGLFEPRMKDVFTRDDDLVCETVRGLEGDVLDVGCGEGRYAELINELTSTGSLRYHALDPDEAAIAALRERCPSAHARVGTLEDLNGERFDHILLLRSWNHLHAPEQAVQACARALRPGGSLIVVDNVAFGLARTPADVARARAKEATWEHFRNDDAGRAHRRIARPSLELVDRHDVGPQTSNQWLLRYRRVSNS